MDKKNIIENYDLSKNSWFGLGGKAKKFFLVDNDNDLETFLKVNNEDIFLVGSGSNVLFRDGGYKGTVIKLGKGFRKIETNEDEIVSGAGVLKSQLSSFALKQSVRGFEFLSCIPGTIGGGLTMNAGCFGSDFSKIVKKVYGFRCTSMPNDFIVTKVFFKAEKGNTEEIKKKIDEFKSVKNISQPQNIKTGGSTFKNPSPDVKAWELIQKSGSNKLHFGGAKFSELHCNFIENSGKSSCDVEKLIECTISEVKKKFNIVLETEIKIIGEK
jgi:UDP-N-acetylmuramate dehydrogenase